MKTMMVVYGKLMVVFMQYVLIGLNVYSLNPKLEVLEAYNLKYPKRQKSIEMDQRTKPPDARIPMRPAIVENLTKDPPDPEAGAPKGPPAEGLFGILPSDIDKYSRLVFPVIFISFNLTYWIIYLHISDTLGEDSVALL